MLLLEEDHLKRAGIDWNKTISVMEDTVECLANQEYAQPIKPYLRYRNLKNRIIAMPAFVGGKTNKAGIKWIASFPDNIRNGLPRAHSVLILNDADTGEPVAIIVTALLSIIRTASVSGMMIRQFDRVRKPAAITIGIIGFGPIGRYHLKMCQDLLGARIARIFLYDIRPIDPGIKKDDGRIELAVSWEEAYLHSDIVITCTVSEAPYIDKQPKTGSLHLNVSLRDYKTSVFEWFKNSIVVDDWDEVCREKTDIEWMHREKGLQKPHTASIIDIVQRGRMDMYEAWLPILFNPMGMAVFDIALGNYYFQAEIDRKAATSGKIGCH